MHLSGKIASSKCSAVVGRREHQEIKRRYK